jgi:hypothetical protein
MNIKNTTTQNQIHLNDIIIEDSSSYDIFRKKIVISLVIMLLFFAYSDKIWAQIEGLYNSSNEQFAGISTLMSATANNDIDGVRFFSKAGPSVINQRNKGGATSLHIASREGNFEIVKVLIENGANVNIVDNEGWSPLMRASLAGKEDIVDILLKNGAKAQLLNSLNESALVHATSAKCLDCINKIIENGNLIKNMDTLVLKSQIADAFLVARSQENQQSQGILESFLDYVSKISPLVLKNSTNIEEDVLPLLSNQSKISNSKLNKFSKNYILKNQDNENLTPEQENTYGVLEDPNLPVASKTSNIKEPEILEKNIPLNNAQNQQKSPIKYKFKSLTKKSDLPQGSPEISNILTNNPQKELKKSKDKNKYSSIVDQKKQTLPKQNEMKKFKLKIGQTNTKYNNIEPSQSNIKNPNNEIKINSSAKNNKIVDVKNQNYNENQMPIQEDQNETIILVEKKPNYINKTNNSSYSDGSNIKSAESDSINSENKKFFKLKRNLNNESNNNKIDNGSQDDINLSINSSANKEGESFKKFRLKKSLNGLEKNYISDEQTEQNI